MSGKDVISVGDIMEVSQSKKRVSVGDEIVPSGYSDATRMFDLRTHKKSNIFRSKVNEEENGNKEPSENKQNSFVTIFTIWNTMLGTSLLAMPWALQQAGLGLGIALILLVSVIACYTAYLTLDATEDVRAIQGKSKSVYMDISDVCQHYFGKPGRIVALTFSIFSLTGSSIVLHVLLSNFLYHTGEFIHHAANGESHPVPQIHGNVNNLTDVRCPIYANASSDPHENSNEWYHKLWIKDRTVPVWVLIILIPLISIKSPTCLGKFCTLGTLSLIYLFILLIVKASHWGVNMRHPPLIEPVHYFSKHFPALTGTCSLGFYVHNGLQTVLRTQKHPENNVRDTVLAFAAVTLTYILVGAIFFFAFPISKMCICDNFLDNMVNDIPVFIGRMALFFQMAMIYPLCVYILRSQLMLALFGNVFPSWYAVTILYTIIIGLGLIFSMLYPSIGTIIRFIGATCGMFYVFALPPIVTLLNKWYLGHKATPSIENNFETDQDIPLLTESTTRWVDEKRKTMWYIRSFFYSFIILFGVLNLIAQFLLLKMD